MPSQDAAYSYETENMAWEYLLFHYGSDSDNLPFPFGPHDALNFPVRCVKTCLDWKAVAPEAKVLELGCAVGRSSFELSRHCAQVVAVDKSSHFIDLALRLQQGEEINYKLNEEGGKVSSRKARRPHNCHPERIIFKCLDVMELPIIENHFDLVLAANLLCRLPDPAAFLEQLHHWVAPGRQLVLISPYSWLEAYTPTSHWLLKEGKSSLESIQEILKPHFILQDCCELPFLMREHLRKYQWGISQASHWIRQSY